MKNISAHNKDYLLKKLTDIDISVPPRGNKRKTENTETWSICRLMSTLAWENKLTYPFVLSKSERPDYVLKQNGKYIGIEISEAVKEDLAHTEALPESENCIIDSSLFKWGEAKKELKEIRKILSKNELSGPGWIGDEPEKKFSDAIAEIVYKKTAKLNEATFTRFEKNWLLIYENLALPSVNKSKASSYLCLKLSKYWFTSTFTKILIESGEFIIEISHSKLCMLKLCDLWQNKIIL